MNDVEYLIARDPADEFGSALAAWGYSGEAIFLTGGHSIAPAYEKAAEIPDWSSSSVWWGDERCVPPDDDRSNYLLAKRSLLDHLEEQPEIHRMRGELDPAEAAEAYEAELEGVEIELLLPPDPIPGCLALEPVELGGIHLLARHFAARLQ